MAAETDSYQVIYKAIADFSSFSKAAKQAQADLKSLQKTQQDYDKSVVQGEAKATAARAVATKGIEAERVALEHDTQSLKAHAKAAAEDAAATKADAAARRELAAAEKSGAGSSGSSRQQTADIKSAAHATDDLTKARRDASRASSELSQTDQQLSTRTTVMNNAMKLAAQTMKDRAAAEREVESAVQDSINTENKRTSTQGQSNSAVRDALQVLRQYQKGQRDLDDEVRQANTTLAAHRKALNDDAAAARSRIKAIENEKNSTSGLTGVLGTLINAISKVGQSGGSDSGKPPWISSLSKGIDEIEGKLGSVGSALGSFFKIGGLISAIGPVITSLTAAGAAAIGFGQDIVSLGGLAIAAVPGLAALATGAGALFVAFRGISSVFKDYTAQQQASQQASITGANTMNTAADKAHSYQAAVIGVADAEHQLAQAQQQVRDAQNQLNEAREKALRDLQDLEFAVRKGPVDEKAAIAALQEAKEAYANTMANPISTLGQREAAAASVDEAQLNLEQTRTQNKRNQQDLAKAQKKGVSGSDQVVSANEALANAQYSVIKAQQGIQDSLYNLNKTIRDNARLTGATATATATYQAALAKLSPQARAFVTGLIAQKSAWKDLKNSVQDRFFAPIVGDLDRLRGLAKPVNVLLSDSAGALGKVADQGIRMVTSGPWTRDFGTIATQNAKLLGTMGSSGLVLLDVLRNLIVAAGPFTQKLANAFLQGAKNLDTLVSKSRSSGRLADWLNLVYMRAHLFWTAIKNLASGFDSLATAAKPFNNWLLTGFVAATQHFKDWAKAQDQAGSSFTTFLNNVKPLLSEIGKFLKDFVIALGQIGSDPRNIKTTTDLFNRLDQILPGIVSFLNGMTQSGILTTLIGLFQQVVNLINALQKLGFIGVLQAVATGVGLIGDGINAVATAFQKAQDFFNWLDKFGPAGKAAATVFHVLGDAIHYAFIALGLLAGLAVIAKFTGLFRIVEALGKVRSGQSILNKIPGIRSLPGIAGGTAKRNAAGADPLTGAASTAATALDELAAAARGAAGAVAGGAVEEDVAAAEGGAVGGGNGRKSKRRGRRGGSSTVLEDLQNDTSGLIGNTDRQLGRAGAAGAAGEAERTAGGLLSRLPIVGRLFGGGAAAAAGGEVGKAGGLLSKIPLLGKLFGGGGAAAAEGGGGGLFSRLGGAMGGGGAIAGLGIGLAAPLIGNLISGGQKKGARAAAGGIVTDAGEGAALGSMFGPIGMGVGAVGGAIIGILTKTPVGKMIKDWWKKTAWPIIKRLPEDFLQWGKDVLHWIEYPFVKAWEFINRGWQDFTHAMSVAWKAVTSALSVAWQVILDILEEPFKLAWSWIQLQWTILKKIFQIGVDLVMGWIKLNWALIKDIIVKPVQLAWDGIKLVWDGIKKAFTDGINGVGVILSGAKTAFSKIWDGIKAIFEAPISFVYHKVLGGIIDALNKVLGWIHLDSLKITLPALPWEGGSGSGGGAPSGSGKEGKSAFAEGDWVPHRGGARVPGVGRGDHVRALLEPGEFVIRRDAASKLPEGFLRAVNNVDRASGTTGGLFNKQDPSRRNYWFGGGVLKNIVGAGEKAWDATGGRLVNWGVEQLRHGAANFLNDVAFPPLRALANGAIGKFGGMPGKMVAGMMNNTMDSVFQWVHGIDNAHKKEVIGQGLSPNISGGQSNYNTDTLQKANAQAIISTILNSGGAARDAEVALMTAIQESNLRNLANPNVPESMNLPHQGIGTDHDSVGLFQQRNSWGSAAARLDPTQTTTLFWNRLKSIGNRNNMTPGQEAQTVQVSAYPDAYNKWQQMAVNLFNLLENPVADKTTARGSVGVRAMAQGGPVDALLSANGLGGGGLASLLDTALPPGMMNKPVTNNNSTSTYGHGINIEKVEISNALPERASDSLPRTIRKISYTSAGPRR